MPFVMVRAEVHTAVPAGTVTVSPSAANATALLISAREGLAALIILACTALEAAKSSAARTKLKTAQFGRKTNGELESKGRRRFVPPVASQRMPDWICVHDGICIATCPDYTCDFQCLNL